jgi:hypothetical protein
MRASDVPSCFRTVSHASARVADAEAARGRPVDAALFKYAIALSLPRRVER